MPVCSVIKLKVGPRMEVMRQRLSSDNLNLWTVNNEIYLTCIHAIHLREVNQENEFQKYYTKLSGNYLGLLL